jgi:CBS-domain-containing membrane protein
VADSAKRATEAEGRGVHVRRLWSLSARPWVAAAYAGLGAAVCVGALEFASVLDRLPYWQIPFITSIALVMGAPESAPAQPRALIGGHLASALMGFPVLWLFGTGPAAAALATGLAVLAMLRLKVFHPPAAVDAFLVVNLALGPAYLVNPVLLGALLLAAFGFVWRRIGRGLSGGAGPSAGA